MNTLERLIILDPTNNFDWDYLSRNNVSLMFILRNSFLPWNWHIFSSRGITIDILLSWPEIPWDMDCISRNSHIMISDILNNPQLAWNYSFVSLNPNLTYSIIVKYPMYPWNYTNLSRNHFSPSSSTTETIIRARSNILNIKYILSTIVLYQKKTRFFKWDMWNPFIRIKTFNVYIPDDIINMLISFIAFSQKNNSQDFFVHKNWVNRYNRDNRV